MPKCPRGFILLRNKLDGSILPFFVRVREDDIFWNKPNESGWTIRNYDNINQIDMKINTDIPTLSFISTKKIKAEITLPYSITSDSIINITKFSNNSPILECSFVEAQLENYNEGLSNTLSVYFINQLGEFTEEQLVNLTGQLNISIHGFLQ